MKFCVKCKKDRPDDDFHPNQPLRGMCRPCIDDRRFKRVREARLTADRAYREQAALLTLIREHISSSLVYLVLVNDRYKIGFSKQFDRRIKTFNTAHEQPCRIVAVAPGGRQEERTLQEQFKELRIAREWFVKSPQITKQFAELPGALVFLPGYLTPDVAAERVQPASI
jgi:hypothetical protein